MKTTISKTFDFDAAHRLDFLPSDHKCHRLHGHTYRVEIVLVGEPDKHGMLIDYADIARAWSEIHDTLDHRYLNDIPGLKYPTTEVVAAWIHEHLMFGSLRGLLYRVRVYESATTYAEVGG